MKDFGSTLGKWKMYISAYESVNCSIFSDSMIPWTVAHQAPLSMEFSRQEYWNGLPFPSPRNIPDPGFKPGSLTLQEDSYPQSHQGSPLFDFGCGPFLKFLLSLLPYCFCFILWVSWLRGRWHLSSSTRDWTYTPALEGKVLTTGLPGKSLGESF